ncbi:glycosyltransferase family 4 protein [Pseudorhodobacter ferrugineus]|uniref:glycosyltransferase family 4 protein n=1 Tax=Pseudorhodobacter ferrugineus TaxID=77008 RepID=UPI00067E0A39|nr:glycosyltransferase family 4 protein [Pseudorhodobacter ferrugineus]
MQNTITQRMVNWLGPALLDVFGQPPEAALWGPDGNVPTEAVYAAENLDPSTAGWRKIYARTPSDEAVSLLAPLLKGALLIGFELSPYQKKICDALDVPYISYAIHPLRFMSDYVFMVDSNFVTVSDLAAFEIATGDIKFAAQLKQAEVAAMPGPRLKAGSAVLFGQVDVDAALLDPWGSFLSLQDHPQALDALFSQHETVYFKPHPYQNAASAQVQFLNRYGNVAFLTTNPYKLLAAPEIAVVSAITSSVLSEALLFNKAVRPLSDGWTDHSKTPAYDLGILSRAFWRQITGDNGINAKPEPRFHGVTLKALLKVSWEDFGRATTEPAGAILPFDIKTSFGKPDGETPLSFDGQWESYSKDHRWMGKGSAFVSFRVPSGDVMPCLIELDIGAMASEAFPVTCYVMCGTAILAQEVFKDRARRTIKLVVPQRHISALGDIVLEVNCNTGNSPKVIGDAPDNRMLSLAFYTLKVSSPKRSQFIGIGQTVHIAEGAATDALLQRGWTKPEPRFVWSSGRHSVLSLVLGRTPDEDIELVLGNVHAFLSDVMPSNAMVVSVNGEVLHRHSFDKVNNVGVDLVVPLPRRFLQNNLGAVDVDINLVGSHSPAMAGVSKDTRDIGIMIQSVHLRSAIGALAAQGQGHIANVIGPFGIHTGLAVMARSTAMALSTAMVQNTGALLGPRAVNFNNSLHLDEDTGFVKAGGTGSKVNLFVGDVTRIERMVKRNGTAFLQDRYNIVYGAWELEQLPTYLADTRYINEFWGLSTFIAEAAKKRMDVPVMAFPIPVDLHYPETLAPRSKFNIPDDRFVFLFTFSIDSTMARKNPQAVLDAFQIAFPDMQVPVCLVIKSMAKQASAQNREDYARFKLRAKNDPRVVLIEETLSRDENASLYMNCDAYISLHRAEGFGLTMAEAMGYGKPTIGTGYSGNLDFMTPENSCLVAFTKVEMEAEAYHNQVQHWAEPDVYDAARHMVRVFEDVRFREQIARAGKRSIHTEFSHEAVGRKLLARLLRIHEG